MDALNRRDEVVAVVNYINDKIEDVQNASTGQCFKVYMEGNADCLQIMFCGSCLWSTEEDDADQSVREQAVHALRTIVQGISAINV